MKGGIVRFQIGKAGITDGAIAQLNNILETHKNVRISMLPSSGRDSSSSKSMADLLVSKLNCQCDYKLIGFTIALKKLSKNKRK